MPGRRKILTILISAAFAWPLMAQSERAVVQLKYLGTAGWEITDGGVVFGLPTMRRFRRSEPGAQARVRRWWRGDRRRHDAARRRAREDSRVAERPRISRQKLNCGDGKARSVRYTHFTNAPDKRTSRA